MVADFKKKRNSSTSKGFLLHFGGFLIVGILILLIVANIRIYNKKKQYVAQVESLQNKIQQIQNQNTKLQKGIDSADDNQYIEKIAREELDLQKEGEKAVSFIMPKETTQKDNSSSEKLFQYWFGWIGSSWGWIKDKF